MAYGVDSGAVMAASVFITIRILSPKWSGPKVVILSGIYCIKFVDMFENRYIDLIHNSHFGINIQNLLYNCPNRNCLVKPDWTCD